MPIVRVETLADPRLAPYRNLKDRDLAREGDRFLAEGELVVRRLLASRFAVESILCAEKRVDELMEVVGGDIPVYAAPSAVVNEILGFQFHSGVMAVGFRGESPTIDDLMSRGGQATLVVCPKIEKTDNLGSLIRISAAMGASGMILGQESCDPFYRQSVRVSMGAAFSVPIMRSTDLMRDLLRLRDEYGVELIATVLAEGAEVLDRAVRRSGIAILLGNETQGLDAEWIEACGRKVTLPMQHGTDSLNVSVAAGVFLYHFMRVAGRNEG